MIEVVFTLAFKDIIKTNFAQVFRSRKILIILILFVGFLAVYMANIYAGMEHDPAIAAVSSVILILGILGALFILFSFFLLIIRGAWYLSNKNMGYVERQTIRLFDDRLIQETRLNKSEVLWSGVRDVSQSKNYIFIKVTGVIYLVIPKRAFRSSFESREFFDFAFSHWQTSKGDNNGSNLQKHTQ